MPILLALLLLILPTSLAAQEVVQPNTITVSGTATVERQPDQAVIRLSVESFAKAAQTATAENSAKMERVLPELRRLGLRENQIRTLGFSVTPEYDYSQGAPRRPGEDRLIGYRARNTIMVTTNEIDQVGRIIDVAINAGVNRVAGLSFQLRDPDAARQEALRLAVAKARAEAEAIASALGRRLGPALAASTTGSFAPPMIMETRAADMAMMAAPPPIEPGVLELSAQVSVVFTLEPPQ